MGGFNNKETARKAGAKSTRKGVQNKTTKEMKELITNFVERELDEVDDLLTELTAKERLDILCKLLPYVLPKQTELISDSDRTVTINFKE